MTRGGRTAAWTVTVLDGRGRVGSQSFSWLAAGHDRHSFHFLHLHSLWFTSALGMVVLNAKNVSGTDIGRIFSFKERNTPSVFNSLELGGFLSSNWSANHSLHSHDH